ncbi:MAG: LOG family protein [Gammaproteobacteria bacterium]
MPKRICIFCGARSGNDTELVSQVRQLAGTFVANEFTLVYGGGAVGLMGVAADAVLAAGGEVIGVIPGFLAKQEILHPKLSETVLVSDLFERKAKMIALSDAFVCLPGGMGTYDELLEVLTWRQLNQTTKPIAMFNYNGYFEPLFEMLRKAAAAEFYDMKYLDDVIVSTTIGDMNSKLLSAIG